MSSKEYRITYGTDIDGRGVTKVDVLKLDNPVADVEAMLSDVYLQAARHVLVEMRDVGPWVKVLEKKAMLVNV